MLLAMAKNPYSYQRTALQGLLRQIRKEAGLTQVGIARRLGQPQSYVSKYESGERRLDLVEIREVCQAAGLSLEDFARRWEEVIA